VADDIDSYLAQSQKARAYEGVLEQALSALAAGDAAGFRRLLSPNLIGSNGAERIAAVIEAQMLPFFAGYQGLGKETTVLNTSDQFGNEGLSFYKTAIGADGAERPFVIYIVEEDGRPVVANLLVNTSYADLHGDAE
jgi:hypothetical protein